MFTLKKEFSTLGFLFSLFHTKVKQEIKLLFCYEKTNCGDSSVNIVMNRDVFFQTDVSMSTLILVLLDTEYNVFSSNIGFSCSMGTTEAFGLSFTSIIIITLLL